MYINELFKIQFLLEYYSGDGEYCGSMILIHLEGLFTFADPTISQQNTFAIHVLIFIS